MAEIVPDGEDGIDGGISRDLGESKVRFDHQGGGRLIPRRNRRIEPTKQASAVCKRTSGHSLSADDDIKQGTPSAAAKGEETEVEEEPKRDMIRMAKAMNRGRR